MKAAPTQEWWTAADLAASGLPDIPATQQGVEAKAKREDWRAHPDLSRRRAGRGGGWEYNWRLLPVRAQTALLKALTVATPPSPPQAERMDRDAAWAWFDGLPEQIKSKARHRLVVIQRIEGLEGPMGKNLAVNTVGRDSNVAPRTVWNWFGMIEGVDLADRLPYLADRHRTGIANRKRSECSPEFLDRLKTAYLRPAVSFRASYDDCPSSNDLEQAA